jgi:hypothetical protein
MKEERKTERQKAPRGWQKSQVLKNISLEKSLKVFRFQSN